ncbi:protein kinase [Streptomyces sp. NPDC014806]|uniref:serine/threonine-protein kinase n=1 Tax=Streptomyces sp. NPDC014806 TaxID=3364920 RepID=UPI0036FB7977
MLAGRYRLDGLIGSGGAADVHRGLDLRLERPVAVKVFRTGADADMEERFPNEALILARLQHPGLVTVYDAGRHDGRPFLVMELIDGPTLKRRIAEGPLTPGATAALGARLARALAHAHEAGIVHRDVKPSNIILDASGRPRLTDFGISRLLDATTHTAPGALVGTAAYLAPEQVLGRSVGPAADVYALGLVLLECLTARLEYDGVPLEAAIARLHRRPVLPQALPRELARLLGDMTALEEADRPSAQECARTLGALADAEGPGPVPSTAVVTLPPSAAVTPLPTADPAPLPTADPAHPSAAGDPAHPTAACDPVRASAAVVTHRSAAAVPSGTAPAPNTDTTQPGPAPVPPRGARGRLLVAGGAVALATAMAATLAVSDGHAPAGSHDTATRTAAPTPAREAPGGPSAHPSTAPASPGGTPSERLRDAALVDDSAAAPARPSRKVPGGPTRHATKAAPPQSGQDGPPEKARKHKEAKGKKGKH